jgi:hypothetical protein
VSAVARHISPQRISASMALFIARSSSLRGINENTYAWMACGQYGNTLSFPQPTTGDVDCQVC